MYSKRVFALMSLLVLLALLMTACGTAAQAPETGKELTISGVVFQDDQFMKSMTQGYEDAGKKYGVPMPLTSITRDLVQTLIGHGYTDQDFSTLLLLEAQASGMELKPENVEVGDGLSS